MTSRGSFGRAARRAAVWLGLGLRDGRDKKATPRSDERGVTEGRALFQRCVAVGPSPGTTATSAGSAGQYATKHFGVPQQVSGEQM